MPIHEADTRRTLNLVVKKIRETGFIKGVSYQIERPQPPTGAGLQWAVKICSKIKGKSVSAVFFIFDDGNYMLENSCHEGPDLVTFERKDASALARLIAAYLLAKYFAAPLEGAFDTYFFSFYYADIYETGCRLSAIRRFNRPHDGGWYRLEVWVMLGEKIRRPVFDIRWFTEERSGKSGSIVGDFGVADKAFRGLLLEIFL